MFEDRGDPAQLSDAALISALTAATRDEAARAAWRLALIAEVAGRQCDDEDEDFAHQVIDGWAFAKAQVGAACNVSAPAASKQMRIAQALRHRLPRTAAVFAQGAVSAAVIDTITWRTRLVEDADALALIDAAIAGEAREYGTKSETGLVGAVDVWVEKFDPVAVVRSKVAAKDVFVEFDDRDDPNGVASFWGRLRVTDKKALEQRLDDLAATVCSDDPRSVRERRADAMGALGVVGPQLERLTCQCGNADCAGSGKDPRSAAVTIYVLTDQVPAAEVETPSKRQPAACRAPASPGVMVGGGVIPAAMLADLAATGAKVKPLAEGADLGVEPRHDPSVKLTAFVRMRYLVCAFPGCGRPAHRCDLDHVVAWPGGATHPGNMAPLCREHHLVKTFCGWEPVLSSDGPVTWTAPTGHRYTKAAGASVLFPDNVICTAVPPPQPVTSTGGGDRGFMMPRRQRTRAQDWTQRIKAERARNAAALDLGRLAYEANPPPY